MSPSVAIDTTGIRSVSMHDLIQATGQSPGDVRDQQVEHGAVLHLAHPEQVGAGAAIHLDDHRSELTDLAVPQRGGPPDDALSKRAPNLSGSSDLRV